MSDFELEIWPGPMEGVMSAEFLHACRRLSLASRWMTPFFRVSAQVPKLKTVTEHLQAFLPERQPVAAQIMGTAPDILAATARLMLRAQAAEVDLNCGCPSKRVVSGGAGGGLLRQPDRLRRILETLRAVLPDGKFSVKTRIGWDVDAMEELLELIVTAGRPDRIFVHIRTVLEQYRDLADVAMPRYERLLALAQAHPETVWVFNGDLSLDHWLIPRLRELDQRFGVMICRNWMRDPFLLRRLAGDADLPDPATGRQRFFAEFSEQQPGFGSRLELARMLWGANSPKFAELLSVAANN